MNRLLVGQCCGASPARSFVVVLGHVAASSGSLPTKGLWGLCAMQHNQALAAGAKDSNSMM